MPYRIVPVYAQENSEFRGQVHLRNLRIKCPGINQTPRIILDVEIISIWILTFISQYNQAIPVNIKGAALFYLNLDSRVCNWFFVHVENENPFLSVKKIDKLLVYSLRNHLHIDKVSSNSVN